MSLLRRITFVFAAIAGLSSALAQAPGPVPALPDAERRTSYSISGSTCNCAINFALLGDGSDYANWVEVFLNGVRVNYNDATYGWTITSPSGALSNLARPITNAVLTFNSAQTGTVQIVGARRPRRASQFSESTGVSARDLNVVITDLVAQNRETWDKTNDVSGRAVQAPAGETIALLPSLSTRQNKGACFDNSGNLTSCVSVPSTTIAAGTGIAFTGSNPTTISSNYVPGFGLTFSGTNPITIAMVPGVGTGNVLGPGSSAIGNLAFWTNGTGTTAGAAPSYQATNPANAALYSQIANASDLTVSHNALQVSLGVPIPAGQQEGYNLPASPTQSAVVGTCRIGAADTTTHGCLGTAGYAITGSPTGGAGAVAVGMFGQGATSVANASVFGGNTIVTNSDGGAPGGVLNPGQNSNFLGSFEADINIIKLAGGGEPTIGNVFGIGVAGGGTSTTSQGDGFQLNALSVITGAMWSNGYRTMAGSAISAFTAGPATTGATTVNSQPITFQGINSSGVAKSGTIFGDSNGSVQIKPALATVLLSPSNASLLIAQSGLGTSNIQLPACTTLGVMTNDASGNINCDGTLRPGLGGGLYAVSAIGVNFNAVGDTAIPFNLPPGHTRIFPFRVNIDHASASITTATYGVFSNTGGGGLAIVPGGTAITVSTAADATTNNAYTNNTVGNASFIGTSLSTPKTLYFRVTNPQGSAATADVQLMYFVMP